MTYPPEWPAPGKMHFRLLQDRLGALDLHCDEGYVVNAYNLGFPEIREVKLPNSLDDGTFDVTRFYGARVVSMDVTLKSHTGITPVSPYIAPESVLRDKLIGYLYPGIRSRLLFSENGDPRVRQVMIRGTSASLAVSQASYNKVNVSWVAPRGVLSSYDERCYQYVFSVTSDDAMTLSIVNEGTVPVDWRAAISGYLVHPRFILNGTQVLQLIYDADPGDIIGLDSFSRTITINGKPAGYTYGVNAPEWFKIPPGISTLTVEHDHFAAAPGYPYAYWQQPSVPPVSDDFERADGPLGAAWATPTAIPVGTTSVPVAINSGSVVVTVADDGTDPHEWGFARNTTAITGGAGQYVEIDVSNLAQAATQGPAAQSKVELYTNMNAANAACQALSVDFAYGDPADPVTPVVFTDPFETTAAWTVVGSGTSIVPGRNGRALQIVGTLPSLTYDLDPAARSDTLLVGAAIRVIQDTGGNISSVRDLFEFRSGGALVGKVSIDNGGSLYATDALGNNRGGSPAGAILPNTWYYVEARYVLSATDGEYALRIDGVDVAGAFDLNTGPGTVYDQIRIPPPNPLSGGTHLYDDLCISTGDEAAFTGSLAVPNGSLVWSMHQYDTGGATTHTVASGVIPYDYTVAPVRLRLESGTDGEQRFLLGGTPVAKAVEPSPIVGTLVGFAANYETFSYLVDPGGFSDDFERAALGPDWVLPVSRGTSRTVVSPTISIGAAVSAAHTGNYPQQVDLATTVGTTLVGGAALTMPSSLSAGYLIIAKVLQDNPGTTPLTASAGWTELGTAVQGANVIRMSCFARLADGTSADALTVTGAATNWVSAVETYWLQPSGYAGTDIVTQLKFASATGATGTADPPALALGAQRDWLFMQSAGLDIATFPSVTQPTGYTGIGSTVVSPGTLVALTSGYRTASQSGTENPAAYTGTTTGRPWIAFTVAIPAGNVKWGAAENVLHEFDPAHLIGVEAVVNSTATGGPPLVELYSHMVPGTSACRALQVDLAARTWKLGHFVDGGDDIVAAATGALPAGAFPFTIRMESDPNGTERFLFNGTLVQSILDAAAPAPTGATRVGFGEFSTTDFTPPPQIRSFTATGTRSESGPPPAAPTSPRIERFTGAPVSGTNWAIPPGTLPANNPPPGGKPPWAWTPPVDPITGEPSILTVHFCFFDQWI